MTSATEGVGNLMGTSLECAQCHDHPSKKWKEPLNNLQLSKTFSLHWQDYLAKHPNISQEDAIDEVFLTLLSRKTRPDERKPFPKQNQDKISADFLTEISHVLISSSEFWTIR